MRFPEYDMSDEEIYGEGPKTWAFHHYGWSAAAIEEMKRTGEWWEDKDAPEDEEEEVECAYCGAIQPPDVEFERDEDGYPICDECKKDQEE